MAEAKASSSTLRQLLSGVRNQHHPIQRRPNLYDPSVHFLSPPYKTIKASFMSPFARTTKLSATAHSIIKIQLRTRQATIQAKNFVRPFQSSTVKMGVHNLANKKEFESAINDHKVVILDAFATWCGPCKAIAPQVVEFSETYPNAHFVKLDVDEVPDVAQDLGIRAMPTFLIFKDGEKVHEVVGANPKALSAAIEKHHPAKADGA